MYVVYIGFCEGVVVAVIYIFVFLGELGMFWWRAGIVAVRMAVLVVSAAVVDQDHTSS